MPQNPLLDIAFAVPFDQIRAEHVIPAIDELLADARARIDDIIDHDGERDYDNTLAALEEATERLEWASGIVSHTESVATYPALREAHGAIQPKLSSFWSSVLLDEGLWNTLQAFAASPAGLQLAGPRKRHLRKMLNEFRREGAKLDPAGKERVAAINVELAELTTQFSQNVLDSTNSFELIIEDERQLAGLPESAKESARESAASKDLLGWRFTLQAPSLIPVLTYLDDRLLREKVWRAYNTRATRGETDNKSIIEDILRLRREKATILGYRDFSDLVLEDRMAGSGAAAEAFVADLRTRTLPFFHKENAALENFCNDLTGSENGPMQPWDIGYCAEKQRSELYDFDEEQLRPYFAVDNVLDGLFETVKRLYGVRVVASAELPVWDAAVRTYKLLDADDRHLASFYVDLYPRENKRAGAWMDGLLLAVPPAPHLALICANVNPPVGGKPALLTHREVETLFHEFGHLMHFCLSQVSVRSLGGTNVAWDFVELPSQIMENWCWEREALDLFAKHYETGEKIPDDLFVRMKRARTYRAANAQMRQVGYANMDLMLHREYGHIENSDVMAYTREVLQQHYPARLPEDYGFIASFGHLFSSTVGYAAGYYSYKWAEVLDADAFTRFRDKGVFNRAIGKKFREQVLAQGDSRPPMELYKAFMGREPGLGPLLERQGLTGSP